MDNDNNNNVLCLDHYTSQLLECSLDIAMLLFKKFIVFCVVLMLDVKMLFFQLTLKDKCG